MDRAHQPPALGTVTVTPLDDRPLPRPGARGLARSLSRAQYTWQAPAAVATELPPGFQHSFECHTEPDGIRRFAPSEGAAAFLVRASLSGAALLVHRTDLDAEQRFAYHASRLLYQLGPRLHAHFDRSFRQEQDLYLPRAGRAGERHILPEGLGKEAQGRGRAWDPAELVRRGREKAAEAGRDNPDPETSIRYGLLEAARRNPLDASRLDDDEALQIVRLALFDLGPARDKVEESQIEAVTSRLLGGVERHLEDDTAAFARWFFENLDNLVHLISKQKKSGGPIARDVVRQAVLELVWRSYRFVGDGVHELMQDFARALPHGLTKQEQACFDGLYRRQAYLGGLPLILLQDRFDFLRECLLALPATTDGIRQGKGVLLRLLQFYAEMTAARRQADRDTKKRRQHRGGGDRAVRARFSGKEASVLDGEDGLFEQVADSLRGRRGARCRCGTTLQWRARLNVEETSADPIVLDDGCAACGYTEPVRLSRRRFREIADGLLCGHDEAGS